MKITVTKFPYDESPDCWDRQVIIPIKDVLQQDQIKHFVKLLNNGLIDQKQEVWFGSFWIGEEQVEFNWSSKEDLDKLFEKAEDVKLQVQRQYHELYKIKRIYESFVDSK